MIALVLCGCSEKPPGGGDGDDDTVVAPGTEDSDPGVEPPGQLRVADADLVIPEEMFAGFWVAFEVVSDVGGDGADDIVGVSQEILDQSYEDSSRRGFTLWPDVLDGAPMWTLKSPAFSRGDGATHVGLSGLWSTPDVTGDGIADLWVADRGGVTSLLAGPLSQPIPDPADQAVATLLWDQPSRTTDLDHDGIGDMLVFVSHAGIGGNDVARCEGPFAGDVDIEGCDLLVQPQWMDLRIHDEADVDGDGVDDVLLSAYGRAIYPEGGFPFTDDSALLVYDGAYLEGIPDPLLTVHPTDTLYFNDGGRTALADLDGDGRGDLVWVESPSTYGDTDGEIAVLHGPLDVGVEYGLADATLHLNGVGQDALVAGVATADAGAWLVLDYTPMNYVGVDTWPSLTPFLVDGALTGTVDPWDAAWFLASDGLEEEDGFSSSEAHVGDFDGDTLGDLLVVDTYGSAAWIYLGASLPPR